MSLYEVQEEHQLSIIDTGFSAIDDGQVVVQEIVFPSVLDYVRFQLLATPMTILLKDMTKLERNATIASVATAALSTPELLDGGPQEAFVAVGRIAR